MQAFLNVAVVVFGCMAVLWWISVLKKDASIIDGFWGASFVVVVTVLALQAEYTLMSRHWLLIALVGIWGLRLTAHITMRSIGKPEDFRYQEFRRKDPGGFWWRSFFTVFLLQGAMVCFVSLPLMMIFQDHETPLGFFDFLAVFVWAVGFAFEAGGDWQLTKFRNDPSNKGKILNTGFWAYTRHPNYFGDSTVWWAFYVMACSVPGGWATILSPIFMMFMLMKVSGVGLLEKELINSKPGYVDYIRSTPSFFPFSHFLTRRIKRRETTNEA